MPSASPLGPSSSRRSTHGQPPSYPPPPAARRIAPATTPDVRFPPPPPLTSAELSAALSSATNSTASSAAESTNAGRKPDSGVRRRHEGTRKVLNSTGSREAVEHEEEEDEEEDEVNQGMLMWGWGLLTFSVVSCVLGWWSIAVGPFVDTRGWPLFNALANDKLYKYLVVFTVPVTLYAVIINWWGLKIFRHA